MENEYVWDEKGVKYRKVNRKANVGELVAIENATRTYGKYENGDIIEVEDWCANGIYSSSAKTNYGNPSGYISHFEYLVLEPVRESAEPTPQLAGIHDSLASLAVEVTKLKSVINGLTGQLTPLQLAILNAENTPADVKLSLIVEAGRLESERQAKLDA